LATSDSGITLNTATAGVNLALTGVGNISLYNTGNLTVTRAPTKDGSIDIVNAHTSSDDHTPTEGVAVGMQRAEHLQQLPIDFNRDEPLAVTIEGADDGRLASDRTFERQRGRGLELEAEVPERRDDQPLKEDATANGDGKQENAAEQWPCDESACAEPKGEAEENARRHEGEQRVRRGVFDAVGMPVGSPVGMPVTV
jgi:hypothetical protein